MSNLSKQYSVAMTLEMTNKRPPAYKPGQHPCHHWSFIHPIVVYGFQSIHVVGLLEPRCIENSESSSNGSLSRHSQAYSISVKVHFETKEYADAQARNESRAISLAKGSLKKQADQCLHLIGLDKVVIERAFSVAAPVARATIVN